ncbi:methyltransferase domain-containing protein [Telmatospirillum siberiense]|nr:methyltransferase domain-containing protein [Telmatospirillum siberiense]
MLSSYYNNNFFDLRIHTPFRVFRRIPWRDIMNVEHRLECNICGWRGPYAALTSDRRERWCPHCKAGNRHRLIAWYLTEKHPDALAKGNRFLHVAPERSLGRCLKAVPGLIYESCDIERRDVTHRIDLQSEIISEAAFDVILINHVLEHIPNDRAALRNIFTMLRPNGLCVITVPIRPNGQPTDEDPSITTEAERERRFGQHDHVRFYGEDLIERIRAEGFFGEILRSADVEPAVVERYSMAGEMLFLARRPESGAR